MNKLHFNWYEFACKQQSILSNLCQFQELEDFLRDNDGNALFSKAMECNNLCNKDVNSLCDKLILYIQKCMNKPTKDDIIYLCEIAVRLFPCISIVSAKK